MKRVTAGLLTFAMLVICLAGCFGGPKFEPKKSSIYVKKDGTVTEAEIESFAGSNYSEEELKSFVEDKVKNYNQSKGAPALAYAKEAEKGTVLPSAVKSLEVKDETATLFLDFASCIDYLEFTGTGAMENGLKQLTKSTVGAAGLQGTFQNADGEPADFADVSGKADYHVVVVEGPVTVMVEGKIQYVSTGAILDDKYTVTTPAEGVCYIIFK